MKANQKTSTLIISLLSMLGLGSMTFAASAIAAGIPKRLETQDGMNNYALSIGEDWPKTKHKSQHPESV